jgi:hypothetical protein
LEFRAVNSCLNQDAVVHGVRLYLVGQFGTGPSTACSRHAILHERIARYPP